MTRRAFGLVIIGGLAVTVATGGAATAMEPVGSLALAVGMVLLAVRLRDKVAQPGEAPSLLDFEIGALLATGLDATLLRYEESLDGHFSPSIYLLAALIVTFARPFAGVLVLGWIVFFDITLRLCLLGDYSIDAISTRAVFVASFGLLNLASLRAEVARVRVTARAHINEELVRIRDDARSYRLLGTAAAPEPTIAHDDRLIHSGVEEIRQSVHYGLELLRRSMNLHTAALLWLNSSGTHLRIRELCSRSDDINDEPFPVGDGVLGAVLARREIVSLENLSPSYRLPYYLGPCPIQAMTAIPVLEEHSLRGVLIIDRSDGEPFTPHEEESAAQAARFCLRAIQNERVFMQLERAKIEEGKLYRAAQALAAALSEEDVLREGVKAAREIASFDFAAVTVFDDTTGTHEVRAVEAPDNALEPLVGARFARNNGLVSMVVENKYPLPYKGEVEGSHAVVLARNIPWPKAASLLVLPLLLHDRALGTLILGAHRRHAFSDTVRPTLEVLASHYAVSLSNARLIRKLEMLATTDGLTGLLNKRAMIESAEQKIAAAARFGRKLSVLVTDIDFFKKVNDTYGHDIGDRVIVGISDVLRRQKRTTDVVARFGGEEFVVLCEQTDENGALLLAERIREDVGRCLFKSNNGTFRITCSIGIATFPDAGQNWESLFKAADEALYISKRSGRNRSTSSRPSRARSSNARATG